MCTKRKNYECKKIKSIVINKSERKIITKTEIIMKRNTEQHRQGLIDLYENTGREESTYMKAVLIEAVKRLKTTSAKPKKVENWVVKCEKEYRKLSNFN